MKANLKKRLAALWDKLGEVQSEIEEVATAHTKYMDERSERWHESDAGTQADMDAGELEDAQNAMEEVVACIDRIIH